MEADLKPALEPLPCPICGDAPQIVRRTGAFGVKCPGVPRRAEHFVHSYGGTEAQAIAAWNTRAGRMDREVVARIIDPLGWDAHDSMPERDFRLSGFGIEHSLSKADQIIALEGDGSGLSGAESARTGTLPVLTETPRDLEGAIHDFAEAIRGRPKSDADAKARDVLRSLAGDAPLAGDQAIAFIALSAHFAARDSVGPAADALDPVAGEAPALNWFCDDLGLIQYDRAQDKRMAKTPFGLYMLHDQRGIHGGWGVGYLPNRITDVLLRFETVDEARAYCDADWKSRMSAALSSGSPPLIPSEASTGKEALDEPNCQSEARGSGKPPPAPPWPPGAANNARREGWERYFRGVGRDACPFPRDRSDLQRGFREGWDAAAALNPPSIPTGEEGETDV